MDIATPNPQQNRLGEVFNDALRYWEPRRIVYNLILAAVTAAWLVFTWPHFRASLTLQSLLLIVILAAAANLCYCAAYLADLFVQYSHFQSEWRERRWILWLAGTLFAVLIANYWIVDEIYPFAR
jgi:hypothetical protein